MATHLQGRRKKTMSRAEGYATPKTDTRPQKIHIMPKKAIPIIFLPGIMGSNLRLNQQRQKELGKKSNIAWRPDATLETSSLLFSTPEERQRGLDMMHTEVDVYDPASNATGDPDETANERHDNGNLDLKFTSSVDNILLVDDPITFQIRRTREQKAMERGWGEIYFKSYRSILEKCEEMLNTHAPNGKWKSIIDVNPEKWQAHPPDSLPPITAEEFLKTVSGCIYPVHAMGYNWLRSSRAGAKEIAARASKLIEKYNSSGYQCEKVIIVTHSMGGLVARALIHPEIGGFGEKVLGVVHGVMPAIGAPAAYKRMRCGFEEGLFKIAPAPKILGNYGSEITAVLANSEGGLELLPSAAYGKGWLRIRQGKLVVARLPAKGDPYEEIYKIRDKWYGLFREEWINPARDEQSSFERTCKLLDYAKSFHFSINSTYHSNSYVHYGADEGRPSWESVTWEIGPGQLYQGWEQSPITYDNEQGEFHLTSTHPINKSTSKIAVKIGLPVGAGDQTVPILSSDHQLSTGKVKGVFRQTGYEHQASYSDERAVNSTLYSLVRIIQNMQWSEK